MGFELRAEFVSQARVRVTGMVDIFQKEQEDTWVVDNASFRQEDTVLKIASLEALRGAAVVVVEKSG